MCGNIRKSMFKIHSSHTYHFSHLASCHFRIVPVNFFRPQSHSVQRKVDRPSGDFVSPRERSFKIKLQLILIIISIGQSKYRNLTLFHVVWSVPAKVFLTVTFSLLFDAFDHILLYVNLRYINIKYHYYHLEVFVRAGNNCFFFLQRSVYCIVMFFYAMVNEGCCATHVLLIAAVVRDLVHCASL